MKKNIQIIIIKIKYFKLFSLADKTCFEVGKLLDLLDKDFCRYKHGAERICIALYNQNVRLLQAIILLCNKGFDEESLVLLRSFMENSAYLLFISQEKHEERAELYQHSRALSEELAVRELNSMTPEGMSQVDDTFSKKNKNIALEYFRKKHGQEKTEKEIKKDYTLNARRAADQLTGDPKEIFNINNKILYRQIAALSHAECPLRFIEDDEEENLKLKFFPDGKSIKISLQASTLLSCYVIDSMINFLKIKMYNPAEYLSEKLVHFMDKS